MSGIFKIFGTFCQLAASAANTIFFGLLDDEPSADEDESQEVSTDESDADELSDDPIINISSSPNKEVEVHCVCEEVNGRLHKLCDLRDYVFDPQDDVQQAMRREEACQKAQAGDLQPLSRTRSIRRTVDQHLQFVSEDRL